MEGLPAAMREHEGDWLPAPRGPRPQPHALVGGFDPSVSVASAAVILLGSSTKIYWIEYPETLLGPYIYLFMLSTCKT